MVHKTIGTAVLFLFMASMAPAQSGMDAVLASIRKNNRQIAASRQYAEAQKLEIQTGNTLTNPFVSADFLRGQPRSGGDQIDFMVTQAFDFPTAYAKRRQFADRQARIYDIELQRITQSVLWEAQQIYLSLIFLNKQRQVFAERLSNSRELRDDFVKKYAVGDIGALPVNKARLHYLGLQHEMRKIEVRIETETERLIEFNGGIEIAVTDTVYPGPPALGALDSLQSMVLRYDPDLRLHRQEVLAAQKMVEVRKARALPQLETGYHYQSVLGQTFNGVHFGATIPLWQHRGKVKASENLVVFREKESEVRILQLQQETKRRYLDYQRLHASLQEFRTALNEISSEEILQKSLELEEIDFITYVLELHFYHEAWDHLLEIEYSYHHTISHLLKSTL